jgi:hypothetical protein
MPSYRRNEPVTAALVRLIINGLVTRFYVDRLPYTCSPSRGLHRALLPDARPRGADWPTVGLFQRSHRIIWVRKWLNNFLRSTIAWNEEILVVAPHGQGGERSKLFASSAPKAKSVVGSYWSYCFLPIVSHPKFRFVSFASYKVLLVDQPAGIN